jgi:fibronectin type 3 domain-containing protein
MKTNRLILAPLLSLTASLLACPGLLVAQDINLAWDPSTSEGVAGYKIYYKAGSGELPMNGTGASEGPSPIKVGKVTSLTLTNLPEGAVYYLRATAYDANGNESGFSNLVESAWVPAPLAAQTSTSQAALLWSTPPQGLNVTFTLVYGRDPYLSNKGLTKQISGLKDTSYTVGRLRSGTNYYWKIIANYGGEKYESDTSSFVTESIKSEGNKVQWQKR